MLVLRQVERERVAVVRVRPEGFPLAPHVVGDDMVRGVQDVTRAAVVLLEPDRAGVLVLLFKIQDILDRRTAEFIDALVIVADHADVPPAAREQRRETVLEVVRILIFVDKHILEFALPVFAHVLKVREELDGVEDDIVKIHRAGGEQAPPVLGVDLADLRAADISHGLGLRDVLLGRNLGVLGGADLGEHRTIGIRLFIQVKIL